MKFSILTVGDEICIGQVINTNAAWIADKLTSIGYSAFLHSTVPDESEIMKSELDRLVNSSDVIVITGGLGPTHDDITKSVLIEYFDDKLIIDIETEQNLEKSFLSRKWIMSEKNRAQALIPSKSKALKNIVGTAPGLLFELGQKLVLSLPGVPAEMRSIFENEFMAIAVEHFQKYSNDVQLYLTIKTAGIPESKLADLIGLPTDFPNSATLAYLPAAATVRLRIGSKSDTYKKAQEYLNEMKNYIIEKAGKYIIGYGNDSLQSVVGNLLRDKKLIISVAESCTGGMLGAAFTEIAGSSEYFKGGIIAYSNEVKRDFLKVHPKTLESFGAVSKQTAIEMAYNVRVYFDTDIGLSITGIAGPDGGTDDKPVGTVWIGISYLNETNAYEYRLGNDRSLNRERAVTKALELIRNKVNDNDFGN
ncbi:MAG: competence/damage-inducible protein A [Candidatus Kapabacteria bacterium]|nr:competence/damage-inducible protein A [Candidatus Kapabacteria bacterium]